MTYEITWVQASGEVRTLLVTTDLNHWQMLGLVRLMSGMAAGTFTVKDI
jgi:hypothetical protein